MEYVGALLIAAAIAALRAFLRTHSKKIKSDAYASLARELGWRHLGQDAGGLGDLDLVVLRISEARGQTPGSDVVTNHIAGTSGELDIDVVECGHRIDSETVAAFTVAVATGRAHRSHVLISSDPLVEETGRRLQLEDTGLGAQRLMTGTGVFAEDPAFASRILDENLADWIRPHVRRFSFEVDKDAVALYARASEIAEVKRTIDLAGEFSKLLDERG